MDCTTLMSLMSPKMARFPFLFIQSVKGLFTSLYTDVTTPHLAKPVETAPNPAHVSRMYWKSLSLIALWPMTTVDGILQIHTLFPRNSTRPWKTVAEGVLGNTTSSKTEVP